MEPWDLPVLAAGGCNTRLLLHPPPSGNAEMVRTQARDLCHIGAAQGARKPLGENFFTRLICQGASPPRLQFVPGHQARREASIP